MPERGFAEALYFQIAGDAEAGRRAIAWALGPGNDLRQQALARLHGPGRLGPLRRRDPYAAAVGAAVRVRHVDPVVAHALRELAHLLGGVDRRCGARSGAPPPGCRGDARPVALL